MKIKHKARHEFNPGGRSDPEPRALNGNSDGEETVSSTIGEDEIAVLAYHYWQERGCPDGCPEEDWLRAERELTSVTSRNE